MQFGIRKLFLVVVVVAGACALIAMGRDFYYYERHQITSILDDNDNIQDIALAGFDDDFMENIVTTRFAITNYPDSIVCIGGLEDYQSTKTFHLAQIGPWKFFISGRRHIGATTFPTGKAVQYDYFNTQIVLGHNSPYRELIPYRIKTLNDVVKNYSNLVKMFDTWPRESNPATVTLNDGTVQYYYVIRDATFPED